MQQSDARELVARLIDRIERHPQTLHFYRARYDRCGRLQKGLEFSKPEDCNCLDLCLEAEDGGDLLPLARATGFCSPVIVYSKADPVAATNVTGAEAWLMIPFNTDALVQTAGRLLDH